jgi:phenylalanyl-tRNA synthetase beta chain
MSRPAGLEFWKHSNSKLDLYDIKEILECVFHAFRIDHGSNLGYDFDAATGRFAWSVKDQIVVDGGVVSDVVAERYDFEQPVWYANLDLTKCYDLRPRQGQLKPLGEYPASKRDLSLVTPAGVEFADIEKSLAKHAGRLLESCVVFDVYRGEKIAKGHVAYGVRLSFRAPDRTLRDKEIDRVIDKTVTRLKNELGVELRS